MSDTVVHMSGDEAKLFRSYQKIIDQAAKLDSKHKEVKKTSDDTFGSSALATLGSYAAGIVSITSAMSGFKQMVSDVKAMGEEMAARQKADMPQIGALAQLAFGDKAAMRRMIQDKDLSYKQGAGATRGESSELQFQISSANYDKYREQLAALKASASIQDVTGLVVGAAAFETTMGAKSGGFPNIANLTIGAAGKSPGEIPNIALGAAKAAGTGAHLGISSRDIYGATAVLAKATGDPQEGGMLAMNLFKGIDAAVAKGILKPGRTLPEYMSDIAAMEAKGRRDTSIVGEDIREFTAYRKLKSGISEGIYAASMADIDQAIATDQFNEIINMYKVDPGMIAARANQQAIAGLEIARQPQGVVSGLAQAVEKDVLKRGIDRGAGPFQQQFSIRSQQFERWLLGDEMYMKFRRGQATSVTQQHIEDAAQALRESGADPSVVRQLEPGSLQSSANFLERASQLLQRAGERLLDGANTARSRGAATAQPE